MQRFITPQPAIRILAGLISALAITPGSFANSAKIEEVTITGRGVNLVGKAISASEGLVSQQELARRPMLRSGEILEAVPGLIATQHSGTGKANQYFLRGFNLDHGTDFATWYDNMPVNMRSHGHGQGYTDLNFIIPEMVEELAYRKGSYYADVGDFSGAGAARLSSFKRLDHGTLAATAGHDDYYRVLAMDSVADLVPGLGGEFLYALELNRYKGPWTDISEDLDKLNLVLKQSWQSAEGGGDISFMAYDNQWNSADQIPLRAVQSGLISELGSLAPEAGGESSRYSLSGNWHHQGWQANAYAIRYRLNLWSNFTYFLEDPLDGDGFEQADEREIYGGDLQYRWHNQAGGIRFDNRIGLESRFDAIGDVGLYQSRNRQRLATVRRDSIDQFSAALFGESEIHWTERFRTVLGVRYDHYDFSVDDRAAINGAGIDLAANSGSDQDGLLSPKFSASYQLNDNWELYASIGRGFHSNDARGVTAVLDPVSGEALSPVNPLVKSRGEELGVRWFLSEHINSSLTLWRLKLDSELLYVGDAGSTEASRGSRREGVEFTTYYRLNDLWTLDLEYAWTDAELTGHAPDEGNKIEGALKQVVSGGIEGRFENGLFLASRVRYFGPRALDSYGDVKSDSTTVVNLRGGIELGNVELALDILNLLDAGDHDIDYYYASRLPGEAEEGVEDLHYHVMEPRTWRLSARWRF